VVTFETFSQLQVAARERVDEGVDIAPSDRDKIKQIDAAEGKVGEGSRVCLVAFCPRENPIPTQGNR